MAKSMEQKIAENVKKLRAGTFEYGLLVLQKAEKYASKKAGTKVTATGSYYSLDKLDEVFGFLPICFEMCIIDDENRKYTRVDDVEVSVCLWDKKQSFASDRIVYR